MARSQPYAVACDGGLVTASNALDLVRTPGVATKLQNFEVSVKGGYRRVSGFAKFGGDSAVKPSGSVDTILGVFPYADGVIACVDDDIYFSNTGTSWLQINRSSVASSGDNHSTFTGRSVLNRTSQGQVQFAIFDTATSDYGTVFIADGANKVYSFRMEGTGILTSRTFFSSEVTVSTTKGVKFLAVHDKHLVAAGVEDNLNTIFFSGTLDPDDFTSTGSGNIVLEDQIEGIKSFRNELFIFCRNSIFKLININDSSNIAVVPVTKNVGCLSGYSIQEIGGDLIFLAPDGLRTVAGTVRIGDVELGTISKQIQPLISDLAETINDFVINSLVIREKSQYRLYYTKTSASDSSQRGIIGTLRPNGFQWSETLGIEVTAIGSNFDNNGVEVYYHGDTNGFVYLHDTGNNFNGSAIDARYQTPNYDYGDFGTLKTLHYIKISFGPEDEIQPDLRVRFDYDSLDIPQPADITLDSVPAPSVFGTAVFGTNKFGASEQPLVRIPLVGSGSSNNFRIQSNDTKASYIVNGFYVDYIPSGRR